MRSHIRHPADLMGIFRAYSEKIGGYYLHVTLRRNGRVYQKTFREKRCGGQDAALTLARAWRDAIIAKYPAMSLAQFCDIVRSNNTTGVAGVYRAVSRYRRKNGAVSERVFWQARVPLPNGKYRLHNFPVATFGEEGGRELAIDARRRGLLELEGTVFREGLQPLPVSTEADMALLDARLRAPAERRQREEAARLAARQRVAERVARLREQADAAERQALSTATNRSGEPYIARNEYVRGGGNWRVSIIRQGQRHSKCFSDSMHGGAEAALQAAKAWRDQLFRSLPVASKAQRTTRVNAANSSGVAGVHRSRDVVGGEVRQYWVAHCPKVKGMPQRGRKFSVAKYGEEQAFALAVAARRAFVAEFEQAAYVHHRAARQMMRALPASVVAVAEEAMK